MDVNQQDKQKLVQLRSDSISGDATKRTRITELGLVLSAIDRQEYGQYVLDHLRNEQDFFA